MLILLVTLATSVRAAEPVVTVLKNTLLGGATGLILGGTITLVVDEDSRGDVIRWGAVLGTFGGFALGVSLALRGEEDLFGRVEPHPAAAGGPVNRTLALCGSTEGSFRERGRPARLAWLPPRDREDENRGSSRIRITLLRLAG